MKPVKDTKVFVRNEQGQYLTGSGAHWKFVDNRDEAVVFDYQQDKLAEQLEWMNKALGAKWLATRVGQQGTAETCDRCGARIVSNACFDGEQCLCEDCRSGASITLPKAA